MRKGEVRWSILDPFARACGTVPERDRCGSTSAWERLPPQGCCGGSVDQRTRRPGGAQNGTNARRHRPPPYRRPATGWRRGTCTVFTPWKPDGGDETVRIRRSRRPKHALSCWSAKREIACEFEIGVEECKKSRKGSEREENEELQMGAGHMFSRNVSQVTATWPCRGGRMLRMMLIACYATARAFRACPPAHLISDVSPARMCPILDLALVTPAASPARTDALPRAAAPGSARPCNLGAQWAAIEARDPKHDRLL